MNILRVAVVAWACFAAVPASGSMAWTQFDYPGAIRTYPKGTYGDTIVGAYQGDIHDATHGFIHDGGGWQTLDFPGAILSYANGVYENQIVGSYSLGGLHRAGFLFDGTTWKSLSYPGAARTWANAIYGNTIVGYYETSNWLIHGFIYDGTTWRTVSYPFTDAIPYGVWAGTIVGVASQGQGFVYGPGHWEGIVHPPSAGYSLLGGIHGDNMVGYCDFYPGATVQRGFLYDGTDFIWLENPWGVSTYAWGIHGDTIVGSYRETYGGDDRGFILTIPEPTSLALLAMAGMLVARRRA